MSLLFLLFDFEFHFCLIVVDWVDRSSSFSSLYTMFFIVDIYISVCHANGTHISSNIDVDSCFIQIDLCREVGKLLCHALRCQFVEHLNTHRPRLYDWGFTCPRYWWNLNAVIVKALTSHYSSL